MQYLRSFVSCDDERSKEIEYSIYKQGQENVQEYSTVEVRYVVILWPYHDKGVVDVISIEQTKQRLNWRVYAIKLHMERTQHDPACQGKSYE